MAGALVQVLIPEYRLMPLALEHYKNRHSVLSKLRRALWNLTWVMLFRTTPRGMLYGWRRFLLRAFGAKIGRGVNVLPSCKVWLPENLTVGDHSCLSEDVTCYCVAPIVIGDQVVVSQGSYLCTASHDISSTIMELTVAPIRIEAQAWVAAQAFVGPGVCIGEGAVVGARAVIMRDVAPWAIAAGNPARVVGQRVLRSDRLQGTA